jgi:hypothetical protein
MPKKQAVSELPFVWECHPDAEKLVKKYIDQCCKKNSFLRDLETALWEETSTHLFDWVDHIELGFSKALVQELEETGFVSQLATPLYRVFHHPRAKLPLVVLKDQANPYISIAVMVDSVADFLMVRGMSVWIEGSPLAPFRRACVSKEQGTSVFIVERRGVLSMEPATITKDDSEKILQAYQKWQTRPRNIEIPEDESEGLVHALALAEEMVELVGQGIAATTVLDIERRYWQAKNTAGQIQKNRQDRLGMGWANHDHHTFRSSRKHFRSLVRLFEILGFHCRERFYAGKEAGWGAQVVEHDTGRFVCFLDVDLAPHELDIDFAHLPLPELDTLGTVGLWCALHGESILKAGMHHLEAQFSFDKLHKDLQKRGVAMMAPFSNFPFLKQAFTIGEMWKVSPMRIYALVKKNLITQEQADRFIEKGALGSHLENLERKEGFKGFNQKNVSAIIKKTDPRRGYENLAGA